MIKAIKGCTNDACVANEKKKRFKAADTFCPQCGQSLHYVCRDCGMQLENGTKARCIRCENLRKDKKDQLLKTAVEAVVVATKKAAKNADEELKKRREARKQQQVLEKKDNESK